jgi:putative transposase
MARRPRLFAPGLLYHVIVRGNQKRKAFLDGDDYQTYLERLGRYRRRYGYTIHAYCSMPNHIHLLLESSAQPLGKFMQGLQQSYSQYFNLRHRKVGHVFQGRYKAIVCQKDAYLLDLIRYIHLNPVRSGIVKDAERYRYSGARSYLDGKPTETIDPRKVLHLLGGKSGYRKFVRDGLGDGHREEYYELEDQRFLGAAGFGEKLQEEEIEPRPRKRKALDVVVKRLGKELKFDIAELVSADRAERWSPHLECIKGAHAHRLHIGAKTRLWIGRDSKIFSQGQRHHRYVAWKACAAAGSGYRSAAANCPTEQESRVVKRSPWSVACR